MTESDMPAYDDHPAMAEWMRRHLVRHHHNYLQFLNESVSAEQRAVQLARLRAELPRETALSEPG